MNKRELIVLFILLCCIPGKPQNVTDSQFNLAYTLLTAGKYFDAVTEGKRLLFFDTALVYAYKANMLIGNAYKAGGRYDDALKYFGSARKYSGNSDEKYAARIEGVKCLIIKRSPGALTHLRSLENEIPGGISGAGSPAYWRGWYYLFIGEPGYAAEEFAKTNEGIFLQAYCDSINKEKYSVNFGRSISYIIPGSGLIYAGEYYKGIMSFAWNAFGIWLTADAAAGSRALDAVLLSNFVWFRFYFGGISNAGKEITNRNNELINSALDFLTTNYKGLKP